MRVCGTANGRGRNVLQLAEFDFIRDMTGDSRTESDCEIVRAPEVHEVASCVGCKVMAVKTSKDGQPAWKGMSICKDCSKVCWLEWGARFWRLPGVELMGTRQRLDVQKLRD